MAREQLKTLTEQMYYILLTLAEPQHGYGIMQEVEKRTGGRVRIGAGTLYNLLSRFEEEDIIVQVSEENRRKIYSLTDKGLNILKDEYQRLKQLVSDGDDILEGRAVKAKTKLNGHHGVSFHLIIKLWKNIWKKWLRRAGCWKRSAATLLNSEPSIPAG